MKNLVRGEIKHLTSRGGDMDSFEWVLTRVQNCYSSHTYQYTIHEHEHTYTGQQQFGD